MKVTLKPVVMGVLRTIPKGLLKGLEDVKIRDQVETIHCYDLLEYRKY